MYLVFKGELREETGMQASAMAYVGAQFIAYGFLNQTCHVYFASDLTDVSQHAYVVITEACSSYHHLLVTKKELQSNA